MQLLVIDPQNDFCDLPAEYCPPDPITHASFAPALPVPGAHTDMLRLSQLLREGGAGITDMAITLDSHHRLDIAHVTFWQQSDGTEVAPFTPITGEDVRAGLYAPRNAQALPRVLSYLDELEARHRYTLIAWPVHCELGTFGHNVHPAMRAAYNDWENATLGTVRKVLKGQNPWTEHYSAIVAEVPYPDAMETQINQDLIEYLDRADQILIAGEASSHCVRATTEHLVEYLPNARRDRLVLLTDCMSPVAGFEAEEDRFFAAMRRLDITLAMSTDVLPELRANGRR